MALIECKCGCGQKIESTLAYSIKFNGVKFRFLNEEHYLKWKDKSAKTKSVLSSEEEEIYCIFIEIFGKDINSRAAFKKEFDTWVCECNATNEDIKKYLIESKKYISDILKRKKIDSVYGQLRYASTIIKSRLPEYITREVTRVKTKDDVSVYSNESLRVVTNRICLEDIEDAYND